MADMRLDAPHAVEGATAGIIQVVTVALVSETVSGQAKLEVLKRRSKARHGTSRARPGNSSAGRPGERRSRAEGRS
jgi:hypothetical protein